jgi:hypothetical protein
MHPFWGLAAGVSRPRRDELVAWFYTNPELAREDWAWHSQRSPEVWVASPPLDARWGRERGHTLMATEHLHAARSLVDAGRYDESLRELDLAGAHLGELRAPTDAAVAGRDLVGTLTTLPGVESGYLALGLRTEEEVRRLREFLRRRTR